MSTNEGLRAEHALHTQPGELRIAQILPANETPAARITDLSADQIAADLTPVGTVFAQDAKVDHEFGSTAPNPEIAGGEVRVEEPGLNSSGKADRSLPELEFAHELRKTRSMTSACAECSQASNDLAPEDLLHRLKASGLQLFCDDLGRPFASLPCTLPVPHNECWLVSSGSRTFRSRLTSLLQREAYGRVKRSALLNVIDAMEDEAEAVGGRRKLSNRFRYESGRVWLDLADPAWRAISVDSDGWKVTNPSEPLFQRYAHQLPLTEPVRGGDLSELRRFVTTNNDADELLLLAWIISALIEERSTPILMQLGQAGGGKSTRSRLLRSLLDPSQTEMLGEIERDNLPRTMLRHAVVCFDNLGVLSRRDADFFCRAVTGAGFERRKLYSDMDQVIVRFKRPIIINAISHPTLRADFLDRCLVVRIARVQAFRPESDIVQEFKQAAPRLLGAILDLLVKVLGVLPRTAAPTEFRMADFAQVGRAVATALGRPEADFDSAYRAAIGGEANDSLDDDPLADAVMALMEAGDWSGMAQELHDRLTAVAKRRKLVCHRPKWPGSAGYLVGRLEELAPLLRHVGIEVELLRRTNRGRPVKLKRPLASAAALFLPRPLSGTHPSELLLDELHGQFGDIFTEGRAS